MFNYGNVNLFYGLRQLQVFKNNLEWTYSNYSKEIPMHNYRVYKTIFREYF